MDNTEAQPIDDLLRYYETRVLALEHSIADLLEMVFYSDTEYDLAVEAKLDELASLIAFEDPDT